MDAYILSGNISCNDVVGPSSQFWIDFYRHYIFSSIYCSQRSPLWLFFSNDAIRIVSSYLNLQKMITFLRTTGKVLEGLKSLYSEYTNGISEIQLANFMKSFRQGYYKKKKIIITWISGQFWISADTVVEISLRWFSRNTTAECWEETGYR